MHHGALMLVQYLAILLVDVVQSRDLNQPPDVLVSQSISIEPAGQFVPLAQPPTVNAKPGYNGAATLLYNTVVLYSTLLYSTFR